MSNPLRIDFVAPPFAGHLFPLLQLARSLSGDSRVAVRVLTTASGLSSVAVSGQKSVELLVGCDAVVSKIADTSRRVGSNPLALIRQLRMNLSLMGQLRDDLLDHWEDHRPDLVVADFVLPVAGLTAAHLGIEWWTGMPTPCVLETGDGTPSYLGGWSPRDGLHGRARDYLGRGFVRAFKRIVHGMFAKEFRTLQVPSVYRTDGLEIAYSPTRILGFGLREFEFERSWPEHFEFLGPLTEPPPFQASALGFEAGKRHVLVSLGTHLPWAREGALKLVREVAGRMPDCVFHFTRGEPGSLSDVREKNIQCVGFLPYRDELGNYDAAIIHGGTGITYACIEKNVPMLVWPHDYDQFDHAARIVRHGLGLKLVTKPRVIEKDLRRLMDDTAAAPSLNRFSQLAAEANAEARFRSLIVDPQ